MENQENYWNKQQVERQEELKNLEMIPNKFGEKCLNYINEGDVILEIGAGNGRDARNFIREKNVLVLANDISIEAVQQLQDASTRDKTTKNIVPMVCDARKIFSILPENQKINSLYARSVLHLDDDEFRAFMINFNSHIAKDGYIFIQGKPKDDFKLERSIEIGVNCYEDIDGHIRRVWSEESFVDLCQTYGFSVIEIENTEEEWQNKTTKFISLIAKKI